MAWLMKRPTVIPMVTAIITPPMSMPLPSAVIPPAAERPEGTKKRTQRRSAHLAGIQIVKNTGCEGANRRDDIGAVEYEVIGYFVGPKRRRGDDDHHKEVESIFRASVWLEIRQRGYNGEGGDDDELGPKWSWLQIPCGR